MTTIIPSNEEASSGQTEKEPELCFYLHCTDIEALRNADPGCAIEQEQYSLPSFDSAGKYLGNFRIRRTKSVEHPDNKYVFTVKNKAAGQDDDSTAQEVSEAMFMAYRKLVDGNGIYKHRYIFSIPDSDLKWEVDAFPDDQGGYHPWLKLDLEYPVGQRPDPVPPFPVPYDKVFTSGNPQDEPQIRELFDKFFNLTPLSKKAAQAAAKE